MEGEKTLAYLHWEKLVKNNDFVQADHFYEKMKAEQQLDAEVCFVMGLWYRQMQQYGQSADAFVQGLIMQPRSGDLYYELANTMREMGNEEAAERYYQYTLALKPNHLDALFCLGQVLAGQERSREAGEYFCKALGQTDSVEEMIAIAVELSAIGMADQAIQVYFCALLQEPDNYYLYSNLGIELAEQQEFTDAIFCHEKALEMTSDNADLWYNLACTYSLMGEAMRGLLALEKAIQLDDENRSYAMQDPELECLQKHKRFWKLVKRSE